MRISFGNVSNVMTLLWILIGEGTIYSDESSITLFMQIPNNFASILSDAKSHRTVLCH
jgi:hypothetical protein